MDFFCLTQNPVIHYGKKPSRLFQRTITTASASIAEAGIVNHPHKPATQVLPDISERTRLCRSLLEQLGL